MERRHNRLFESELARQTFAVARHQRRLRRGPPGKPNAHQISRQGSPGRDDEIGSEKETRAQR